jgi:hypothetical protein
VAIVVTISSIANNKDIFNNQFETMKRWKNQNNPVVSTKKNGKKGIKYFLDT